MTPDSPIPLVSVVMPAFNHASTVEQALRSVLSQTYQNIEIILVDDGSTDDTPDAVRRLVRSLPDADRGRVRTFFRRNHGISATLNFGIAQARGDVLGILATDDWFTPEKITAQLPLLIGPEARPRTGLVHGSAVYVDPEGRQTNLTGHYTPTEGAGEDIFDGIVALRTSTVAPTVLFTREAFDAAGGFDERFVAEDVDFFARVAHAGFGFAYLPEVVLYKRVGGANLGGQFAKWYREHFRTLDKFRRELAPERYQALKRQLYARLIRAAAGAGALGIAWQLTREAAPLLGLAAYGRFMRYAARHLVLSHLPGDLRARLRSARNRSLAGASSQRV